MFLEALKVEFSGGCELLFGNQSSICLRSVVPAGATLGSLVTELRNSYVRERPEQFALPGEAPGAFYLRPGVLALVNDCDAEVMGGDDYVLQNGDTVSFISTLHGG